MQGRSSGYIVRRNCEDIQDVEIRVGDGKLKQSACITADGNTVWRVQMNTVIDPEKADSHKDKVFP